MLNSFYNDRNSIIKMKKFNDDILVATDQLGTLRVYNKKD